MKEQNFKKGVRAYLKKHQYGNAEAEDLWQSLTEFSNLPGDLTIQQVMDTWTNQPGYPVVTFNGTTLTQERFFLNASGNFTVGFYCQAIHKKFLQRFDTIFGLKLMVKSGLEKNILKFHGGLQRYLLTCPANSAFLGRFFLHWAAATKGHR